MSKLRTLGLIAVLASVWFFYNLGTVTISGKTLKVAIADSEGERIKGLSGSKTLGKNNGLLFIFEKPDYYQFWMKDMLFPIDLIWIDEDKIIVDLTKNISPETYPKTFQPTKPVKYVIEVNAGWLEKNDIKIGSEVNDRLIFTF